MKATPPLTRFVLGALLFATAGIGIAQGPPGRDYDNPPPGHGGVPPGQAKKHGHDDDHMSPGQAKKYRDDDMPPGQAKKYRRDYHFESEDRGRFYSYYRGDADRWRGHRRPVFVTGSVVPGECHSSGAADVLGRCATSASGLSIWILRGLCGGL